MILKDIVWSAWLATTAWSETPAEVKASAATPEAKPASFDYKNPSLPIEKRVADLLSKMTPEEKAAQMQSLYAGQIKLRQSVIDDPAKMLALFKNGMGMMNPDFEATMEQPVEWRNKLQAYLLTKTRLGIPII